MLLSVTEAATILQISPRAVRARVSSGALRAVKRGGAWAIDRADLPLSTEQRRALRDKADRVREAVEAALPDSVRGAPHLGDSPAFRALTALVRDTPPGVGDSTRQSLQFARQCLAEAHYEFEPGLKASALRRGRAALAHAAAELLSTEDPKLGESLVRRLEVEVLPRLGGHLRRLERDR